MPEQPPEKLGTVPPAQAELQPRPEPDAGLTPASVLIGLGLLLVLGLGLPYWSLTKNYPLGFGGYLPLEAFFLVLALLVFNRFRGAFALVAGLLALAALAPSWHAAAYARTDAMVKELPPLAHYLRLTFAGSIEQAMKSPGHPALLVGLGCLALFGVSAGLFWAFFRPVRAASRRLVWREILVVFVLLSVGTYSCKSIQWLTGLLTVPYRFDNNSRDFKGKFLRPVPVDQQVLTDSGLIEDLGRIQADPEAAGRSERFRGYRTFRALRALAALRENPADARACEELRDGAWGPEAREALAAISAGTDEAELRRALAKAHDAARARAHENARDEALYELREYNAAGIPSFLVPFDIYKFDQSTPEGRLLFRLEAEALERYGKGWNKLAPQPGKTPVPRAENFLVRNKDNGDESFDAEGYRALRELYQTEYRAHRDESAGKRAEAWAAFCERWKRPLKWWLPLLGLVMLSQVFLAALLRRQWCDHEKLMFPHAEAVRGLVEGDEPGARVRRTLSSRMLWIGAAVSVVIFTFQGLHAYFPNVPGPGLHQLSIATFVSERPWTAMDKAVNIQPYLVSIAYLLTTEVSLSVWFFALVNQGLRVAAAAWGFQRTECWAIHGEVMNSDALYAGSMFVFVGWLVWGGRRHIWYLARRALGLAPADADEKSEPMSYPLAVWGFWLSAAGILLWCALAGLKLWIMAVTFGFFLILVLLMCRLVSEAGLVAGGLNWWPFWPNSVFCHLFGFGQTGTFGRMLAYKQSWLSPGGLVGVKQIPATVRAYGVFQFIWPSMLYHIQLAPLMLVAFKLSEAEPRRRRLLTAVAVLGIFGAAALFLHGTMTAVFERGADNVDVSAFQHWSWAFNNTLVRDVITGERMWVPDVFRITMMFVGGAVMSGLLVLRGAFYWWPLHPLGFAGFGLEWGMWFSFLIGWLVKRAALNYGGGEFSQKINPFFYGLIAGQFAMAAFWALVGICGQGVAVQSSILPACGS